MTATCISADHLAIAVSILAVLIAIASLRLRPKP